jgi:hypothetical protein
MGSHNNINNHHKGETDDLAQLANCQPQSGVELLIMLINDQDELDRKIRDVIVKESAWRQPRLCGPK